MPTYHLRSATGFFRSFFIAAMIFSVPALTAASEGFFTLTGVGAASFALPSDVTLARTARIERSGITIERYQQSHDGAQVLGGQITIHRDEDGNIIRVAGAHYPDIAPTNKVRITAAGARGIVDRDIGPDGKRRVTLMIDPMSQKFFWRVETRRDTSRWVHWIRAGDGRTVNKFDALTNCSGEGMALDRDPVAHGDDVKDLDCQAIGSSSTQLVTSDGVQRTFNQGSTNKPFLGPIATDGDSYWDVPGRTSPGTGALVDAHYYMNHARQYFLSEYGFDFKKEYGHPVDIHAHFFKDYVNAFWNGSYFAFGDGDGSAYDPLTSMDVTAHEFAHAVTERSNGLIYQGESGALNESFSDIMAAVIERLSDGQVLKPEPDADLAVFGTEWLMGEDFDLVNGDGFRNMADPTREGDPDHYANRYTGSNDNGGVHINSGIPNHAFYQLVEVEGVDVQRAADIFFGGFSLLTQNADFCDAREATIAVATTEETAVRAAWDHVGVNATLCDGATSSPALPVADFSLSCVNLSCSFTDRSTDTVDGGTIVAWSWDFDDDTTVDSTDQNPSKVFTAAGTYPVSLTVTDNDGLSDSVTKDVAVSEGSNGAVTLEVSPFKFKGIRHAWLMWNIASGEVDIYVDGQLGGDREKVSAGSGTSAPGYDLTIGGKGGGTFMIKVCEAGTSICSSEVGAAF